MMVVVPFGAMLGLVVGVFYTAWLFMYTCGAHWPTKLAALTIFKSTLCGTALGVIAQLLSNL